MQATKATNAVPTTVVRIPAYLLADIRELVAADPDLELSEVFVMGLESWLLN
jgi:hypothetical protein